MFCFSMSADEGHSGDAILDLERSALKIKEKKRTVDFWEIQPYLKSSWPGFPHTRNIEV